MQTQRERLRETQQATRRRRGGAQCERESCRQTRAQRRINHAKFFSFFDRMRLLLCRNASASPPQSLSPGVAEGAHARKDHAGSLRQPSPEAADAREPSPERADARESLAAMRTQRYLELSLLVLVLVPLPSLLLSLLLLAMQRRFHCNVILPSIRHASRWPHADQLRITL